MKKIFSLVLTLAMVLSLTTVVMADGNTITVGADGCDFSTLDAAVTAANAATSDVTIELNANAEISGSLIIENVNGKVITLNGNGHTLSPSANANFTKNYAIAVKSPLNINGLNVDGIVKNNKTFHIINILEGNVTIENCKFNNNAINSSYGSIIKLGFQNELYTGTVEILFTEFKNNKAPSGVISEDNGASEYSVEVDNCIFEENNITTSAAPISLAGDLTITNNEFVNNRASGNAYTAGGIYAWGTSATITDNTFSGNDVYIKEGKVGSTAIIATTRDNNIDLSGNTVLDDGTVNVKASGSDQYEETDSTAIFVRDKGTAVAEISSGNINGKIVTDTTEETPNIAITGGSFDTNVEEFIAGDAIMEDDGNGNFVVVGPEEEEREDREPSEPTPAEIERDRVVAAIKSAEDGETVVLDVKDTSVVSRFIADAMSGKNVNLEYPLGEETVTVNGKSVPKTPAYRVWYSLELFKQFA